MLLGAWPIGGVKHSSLHNVSEKRGKCRFIILCGCYALFLIIGAAIFSVIEAPLLDKYQRELAESKGKFVQRHSCINSKLNIYVCVCSRHYEFSLSVTIFRFPSFPFKLNEVNENLICIKRGKIETLRWCVE